MDAKKLYRISQAAEAAGVNRSTLVTAVRRGDLPCYETACGLPLITLGDAKVWAKQERRSGRKAAK